MNQILQYQKPMSAQMNAVMMIVQSNIELTKIAKPFIDLKLERISWDEIFKRSVSASQKAAFAWAYALWRDEPRTKINLFDGALNLDDEIKSAVLSAMQIRWGISQKEIESIKRQDTILGGV